MEAHACVLDSCTKYALLINLMDSVHTLLCLQSPLFSTLFSLLSTIKAINTLWQQILLSNVTRKIHYGAERRKKLGKDSTGRRGQGEIKDQG